MILLQDTHTRGVGNDTFLSWLIASPRTAVLFTDHGVRVALQLVDHYLGTRHQQVLYPDRSRFIEYPFRVGSSEFTVS